MAPGRRLKLRSRTGCLRCRRRHQKCDEARPSCSRCVDAGSVCAYGGGNPDSNAQRVVLSRNRRDSLLALYTVFGDTIPLIDPSHSSCLSYFIEDASTAISCHESIQLDTCQAIVSVGSSFPCLLYSSLVLSVLHKASTVDDPAFGGKLAIQALELHAAALSMLKAELQKGPGSNQDVVIATALMLATCELRYNPETGTWRDHFECTRRLVGSNLSQWRPQDHESALTRFIRRTFTTLEFLVALPTPWSHQPRSILSLDRPSSLPSVQDSGAIESTLAFCVDLLEVFRWIGTLEDIEYWSMAAGALKMNMSYTYIRSMARELIFIVHQMMARDRRTPPTMAAEFTGQTFTDGQLGEYRKFNTIAQHVALICLYRYTSSDDSGLGNVSRSIDSMIRLIDSMSMHVGLHPSICLTTDLFIAGCEARKGHRDRIKTLLESQHEVTKSRSTQKALEMLAKVWAASSDDHDDTKTRNYATCLYYPSCMVSNVVKYVNADYSLVTLCEDFIPY